MSAARWVLALLLCAASARAEPERALPAGFGSDARAAQAWRAFEAGEPVRSRELALDLAASDPEGFAAHCLLAQVLRRAEGEPAQALRHARLCRSAFESRHGAAPPADAPWFWHRLSIHEIYAASEGLERHAESLRALDALEHYHLGMVDAFRAWPLLRLGRLAEARAAAQKALERRANRVQIAKAWTALCALEGREQHRRAAYDACANALELGPNPDDRSIRLVNAAQAARAYGRSDEAERLLREATTHFVPGVLASPWLELGLLYASQARTSEALGALREMRRWQARQPLALRAQSFAEHERAAALVALAAARPALAARAAERAASAPDRSGERSASAAEISLATALLERASCRAAAEQRLEEASWAPLVARPRAWLDALRGWGCAWTAERRAADRLSRERHYAPGELELPDWLELDAVAVAGVVPMQALAGSARGNTDVWRAELADLRGDPAATLAAAESALEALPPSEALLRARAAVRAGNAALELGDRARASGHFALALALDGGVLRRLGSALPVEPAPDANPASHTALDVLLASPRLRAARGALRLQVAADGARARACLLDADGAALACARLERHVSESDLALARRLSAAFHARAFAPAIDPALLRLGSLDDATAELPAFDAALEAEQKLLDELLR